MIETSWEIANKKIDLNL